MIRRAVEHPIYVLCRIQPMKQHGMVEIRQGEADLTEMAGHVCMCLRLGYICREVWCHVGRMCVLNAHGALAVNESRQAVADPAVYRKTTVQDIVQYERHLVMALGVA